MIAFCGLVVVLGVIAIRGTFWWLKMRQINRLAAREHGVRHGCHDEAPSGCGDEYGGDLLRGDGNGGKYDLTSEFCAIAAQAVRGQAEGRTVEQLLAAEREFARRESAKAKAKKERPIVLTELMDVRKK